MLRKIIIRTFLVGAGLFALVVVSLGTAAFLAFQSPGFYTKLREQNSIDPVAVARMETKARHFKEWAMKSAALAEGNNNARFPRGTTHREVSPTYRFDLTEEQLNTLLASNRFAAGDVRNPRVQLLKDRLRLGAELLVGDSHLIFSTDLKPRFTSDGSLQLEIVAARMGSLRLPLHTILKLLSSHMESSHPQVQLDVSGQRPVLTIRPTRHRQKSPTVQSIQCTAGEMAIEFHAPARDS